MSNPSIGNCECPLCHEPGAEVRQGVKQALYIVCDNCVSQVRTMSRNGRTIMQRLIGDSSPAVPEMVKVKPVAAAVDEALEAKPEPAAKPAKKPASSGGSWLGL